MTVSRALHKPEMVSEPLRAKILKAVDELGYVRNRVASGLASGTARLVPVVIPTLLHPVYIPFLEGAYSVLAQHGYQIILSTTEYHVSAEDQLIEALLGWFPDGLFLSGVDHSARTMSVLKRVHIPIVEVMDLSDSPIGINVGFSHHKVGVAVAEYFHRKGYRQIAYAGTMTEIDLRSVQTYSRLSTDAERLRVAVSLHPAEQRAIFDRSWRQAFKRAATPATGYPSRFLRER